MLAPGHKAFGFLAGIIAITIFNLMGIVPEHLFATLIYFALVLLGSIFPDIDRSNSFLGRRTKIISIPISIVFGHRKLFHSLLFVVLVYAAGMILMVQMQWDLYYLNGFIVGIISHLMADYVTKRGIPIFYPFSKTYFRFLITFRTGSALEYSITGLLIIINVVLIIIFVRNGMIVI
jgi:inner membrane protein